MILNGYKFLDISILKLIKIEISTFLKNLIVNSEMLLLDERVKH